MADLKQPTNQSQPSQNEPRMKTPPAVNPFNRAKELEDDVPVVKQDNTSPQKDSNPKIVHNHQPSQDKQTLKEAIPGATTYDPYADLKKGKNEEEVIHKLKDENTKLRKELKSISDDLTVLLEKKKTKKTYRNNLVKDIVSNSGVSETGLRAELETVHKQIAMYQKELEKMKGKYTAQATYERYEELQDNIRENEAKIQEVIVEKRSLEKVLREKEKVLDSVYAEADTNTRLKTLTEELRINRERLKDAEKRKETLETQIPKRKEYAENIVKELESLTKEVQRIQQKTGYRHQEVTKSNSSYTKKLNKHSSDRGSIKSKKVPISQPAEEEILEFNEENFAKLQKEFKILQKAEKTREEKNGKDLDDLFEKVSALENSDLPQKIAEKEKEIALLTAKTKEISRIVRHQAVAPLQKEEELLAKETSLSSKDDMKSLLNRKEGSSSPTKFRSSSKAKKEPVPVKRPQPYHLLVQYAKQNFQSKGFRKDERGKPVAEDEGENFNDKDIIGKQKVKIIAIDVWYDEQKITGIQAVYENDKGEIIEGGPHVANPEKAKMVTFETLEEDYLKEISGFMNKNETVIECLIMKTFRGEIMKIGQPQKDSKQFNFDINELEYPAILYGSVKVDDENNGRLTRLGVLISADPIEERIGHREHKAENAEEKGEKAEGEKGEEGEKKEGSKKSLQEDGSKKSLKEVDQQEAHDRRNTEKEVNKTEKSVKEVDRSKADSSRSKETSQVIQEQQEKEDRKMTSRNEVDGGDSSYRVGKVISQREN